MSNLPNLQDENSIYEWLSKKISSKSFRDPLKYFIDENCQSFIGLDENSFEQGQLFNEFTQFIDNLLQDVLDEGKLTQEMFTLACKRGLEDPKYKNYFEQLISFSNYNFFKSMMTKRNFQIIRYAEEQMAKNEKDQNLIPSDVERKNLEDKELEEAIKMSLAADEETRRIAEIEDEELRRAIKMSLQDIENPKKNNEPEKVQMETVKPQFEAPKEEPKVEPPKVEAKVEPNFEPKFEVKRDQPNTQNEPLKESEYNLLPKNDNIVLPNLFQRPTLDGSKISNFQEKRSIKQLQPLNPELIEQKRNELKGNKGLIDDSDEEEDNKGQVTKTSGNNNNEFLETFIKDQKIEYSENKEPVQSQEANILQQKENIDYLKKLNEAEKVRAQKMKEYRELVLKMKDEQRNNAAQKLSQEELNKLEDRKKLAAMLKDKLKK